MVEVRTEEEILRTLDADGKLDGLPFMPEMLSFCGQRYRVRARAHKACDTIDWQQFRRMESAVHLEELRCDGSAHGGCQAGCLLYWKEAWLRPVDPQEGERTLEDRRRRSFPGGTERRDSDWSERSRPTVVLVSGDRAAESDEGAARVVGAEPIRAGRHLR